MWASMKECSSLEPKATNMADNWPSMKAARKAHVTAALKVESTVAMKDKTKAASMYVGICIFCEIRLSVIKSSTYPLSFSQF